MGMLTNQIGLRKKLMELLKPEIRDERLIGAVAGKGIGNDLRNHV